MKPMEGIKVVELSTMLAGPMTARILAEWGADVIKVESMNGDAWREQAGTSLSPRTETANPNFDMQNINKRFLSVNMRTEEGKAAMMKLLATADVFLTNYRVQALTPMGLTYEQLKEQFPRLIHASVLGYGDKGPEKDRPGYDYTAFCARTGLMADMAPAGGPPIMTVAGLGDHSVAVALSGAIAAAREAIGALNSKLAPDHQEDVPTLLNHANQTQAGDANMLMYKTWAEKSGEMIEWMADTLGPKGMLFPFEWHCPDDPHAYYPAMCYNPCIGEYNPDGPNYNSYAHLEVMRDVFTEDLGGEIRFECPAQQLVIDESGRVTGVVAEGKEGFIQVNAAKGVIICTGGYGANNEMLADLAPGNSAWCALRDSVTETGDGIRMALWAGAELEAGGACMIWNRAILPDGFEFNEDRMGGDIFLPGSQPSCT